MEIIKINHNNIDVAVVYAAEIIIKGGVAVVPTDTVYGLAVNPFDEAAAEKLFKIKNRPKDRPVPIFVKNLAMARRLSFIDARKEKFLKRVWPGKITVVLDKKNLVPNFLTGWQKTIGLRIPDFEFINLLIKKLNFPITGTSANISGGRPETKIKKIVSQFKDKELKPDLIVDAGDLPQSEPSTVIDLTGKEPIVLRVGPVDKKQLSNVIDVRRPYKDV